ncbi:MAG: S-layer homology domain-containing protein, partial [Clostridia bacterium]|nr:S-layer homology domain-containing protein [Clostridia bacterium]
PIVSVSNDGGRRYRSTYFSKDGHVLKGKGLSLEGADISKMFPRVYNVIKYRGDIYATLRFSFSGFTEVQSAAYRAYEGIYKYNKEDNIFEYQGTAPNEIVRNSMAPSSDAVFNDRVVIAYGAMKVSTNDNLTAWDTVTGFSGSVTAMEVIGGRLYFIAYEANAEGGFTNRLYATDDLKSFEEVYSFNDVNFIRSMCYCDGVFYLGSESPRGNANNKNGTVYSLVLSKENCTHDNCETEYTSSGLKTAVIEEETVTEVIPGKYSVSCPECGEVSSRYLHPFNDLKVTWYTEPVLKAYEMGMINGNSINTFGPDGNTTRAHLVAVLYNMEGKPDVSDVSTPLTDIDGWYNAAIKWAYSAGVVNGNTATTFDPNGKVTREQFAAILYRYAQYKGITTDDRADLSGYKDADKISSYATDAMSWANARGYIGGVSATSISPKAGATRAQMATILVRYVEDNK